MVAILREEGEINREEGHRGDGARGQHAACGQHSDENAVVEEGGDTSQRNQQNPRQIGLCSLDDEGFRGQNRQETACADGIHRGEENDHHRTPDKQPSVGRVERRPVFRTEEFAAQGLACVGKTVHDV